MQLAEALKDWREFYLLVGTAGATLLALLFVAVSLGAGYLNQKRQAGTRTFMSPVVIHFASVFFLSALAMIPGHAALFYAVPVGAIALIGAAVSCYITVQVIRTDMTSYLQDYFAYGLLPLIAYLALLAAAAAICFEHPLATDLLAGSLLLLAIINIRNAWDLTLAMVLHQSRRK